MGEPSGSTSSDYFEPEDPAFNETLQTTFLPGDVQDPRPVPDAQTNQTRGQPTLKRSRSMVEESDASTPHRVIPLEENLGLSDEDEETYGAASFGGFGQYMRRKRAKLQIQNGQMDNTDNESPEKSRIFQGIAIYVRFVSDRIGRTDVQGYIFLRLMDGQNRLCRTSASWLCNMEAFFMRT